MTLRRFIRAANTAVSWECLLLALAVLLLWWDSIQTITYAKSTFWGHVWMLESCDGVLLVGRETAVRNETGLRFIRTKSFERLINELDMPHWIGFGTMSRAFPAGSVTAWSAPHWFVALALLIPFLNWLRLRRYRHRHDPPAAVE